MQDSFNSTRLAIDIKVADRFREWFSKRGTQGNIQLTNISLGDSDVDYHINNDDIKILNAPYQPYNIKYKLLYQSPVNGKLSGVISCYIRRINPVNGEVSSLYNYPGQPLTTPDKFLPGVIPPTIENGVDFDYVFFDETNNLAQGIVVFLQTIPDNFFDQVTGKPLRIKETYIVTLGNTFPSIFDFNMDTVNGSFMIAKPLDYVFQNLTATITIKGVNSAISKTIIVNY